MKSAFGETSIWMDEAGKVPPRKQIPPGWRFSDDFQESSNVTSSNVLRVLYESGGFHFSDFSINSMSNTGIQEVDPIQIFFYFSCIPIINFQGHAVSFSGRVRPHLGPIKG